MADRNYLRIGVLCRTKRDLWQKPRQVVRVEMRRYKAEWGPVFVSPLDGPAGYGVWVDSRELVPLTPLELLAMQVEEKEEHASA